MKILINGLLPYDSGKTTFAIHLLRELNSLGYKFRPLKPIAGHNLWYSYTTLLRSKELGVLAGNDALKYYDETSFPIVEINPFSLLLAPPDLEKIGFDIRLYNELVSTGLPVMARYYDCESVTHVYSSTSLSIIPDTIRQPLRDFIEEVNAIEVDNSKISELINVSPTIADQCISKYNNTNLVIESYNDALAPTYMSTQVDLVFTVSPGKVFLLQDFNKVLQLFTSPPWNIKVSTFLRYSKVISWKIYPLANVVDKGLVDFLARKLEDENNIL